MNPNYKNIWQEFCCDLVEGRKLDVLEEEYQKTVETNLRQLGWSKLNGEICPKERINVGAHGQIEPDITIRLDGKVMFVIEMKRPNNKVDSRQEQQLLSYMRMYKNSFGLYIGHEIRLYYDANEDRPLMVWHSPIELDAEEGVNFVDMFLRQTFNKQRVEDFCKMEASRLLTKKTLDDFKKSIKADPNLAIRDVVRNYLVNDKGCEIELVDKYLESVSFQVASSKSREGKFLQVKINPVNSKSSASAKSSACKGKRVYTRYSLDGGKNYYAKRKFVREVVIKYVEENPALTFGELQQVFPDKLQGTYGVLRSAEELNASSHDKSDLNTRYFMKEEQLLRSADGILYAVSNQWGSYNLPNVLSLVESWGWNVTTDK